MTEQEDFVLRENRSLQRMLNQAKFLADGRDPERLYVRWWSVASNDPHLLNTEGRAIMLSFRAQRDAYKEKADALEAYILNKKPASTGLEPPRDPFSELAEVKSALATTQTAPTTPPAVSERVEPAREGGSELGLVSKLRAKNAPAVVERPAHVEERVWNALSQATKNLLLTNPAAFGGQVTMTRAKLDGTWVPVRRGKNKKKKREKRFGVMRNENQTPQQEHGGEAGGGTPASAVGPDGGDDAVETSPDEEMES